MSQPTFAVVIGNLGRDAETRYLPNGNSVTSFSVASNSFWKDKTTGKQNKRTVWTPIQVWGKYGEAIAAKAKKGAYVTVTGPLVSREIKRGDGSTYNRLELKAQSVDFGPARQAQPAHTEEEMPVMNENEISDPQPSDEEIPA